MTEALRAVVVGCGVGRNHADAYTHSDAAEVTPEDDFTIRRRVAL